MGEKLSSHGDALTDSLSYDWKVLTRFLIGCCGLTTCSSKRAILSRIMFGLHADVLSALARHFGFLHCRMTQRSSQTQTHLTGI